MRLLNIPLSESTLKCCACDEVKCVHREFDGCEQCEVMAGFWLRQLGRMIEPPLWGLDGRLHLATGPPNCFC